MSNTAETPDVPPPAARNPRSRALVITAVVLVAAFLGLTTFSGFYTDRLWYVSGGYAGVFTTLIWTRIGLFVVTGLLMALVVCLNVVLAYRMRPIFVGMGDPNGMGRYREAVTPIRRLVVLGIGLVLLGIPLELAERGWSPLATGLVLVPSAVVALAWAYLR